MVKRVEAGTDVAMIGAWDATRREAIPAQAGAKKWLELLEQDAADGHLFLIHTEADGGGPIDVYVDEPVPAGVLRTARRLGDEFLITVPSGQLVIAGAEDYRTSQPPEHVSDQSLSSLPAGDYALRCFAGPDDDKQEAASEKELKKLVGAEQIRYYDRMALLTACGGMIFPFVLFLLLAFKLGWKIALPVAIVAFFLYWPIAAWLLKHTPRWRDLDKVISPYRRATASPTFILELRQVPDRKGLKGGSVRLE